MLSSVAGHPSCDLGALADDPEQLAAYHFRVGAGPVYPYSCVQFTESGLDQIPSGKNIVGESQAVNPCCEVSDVADPKARSRAASNGTKRIGITQYAPEYISRGEFLPAGGIAEQLGLVDGENATVQHSVGVFGLMCTGLVIADSAKN